MRTNIEIDDDLLQQAMEAAKASTKKETVEVALRLAVQLHRQQQALKKLWGMGWEGDLATMRENEHQDWDSAWQDADNRKRRSVA